MVISIIVVVITMIPTVERGKNTEHAPHITVVREVMQISETNAMITLKSYS